MNAAGVRYHRAMAAPPKDDRKAVIDALLRALPGVANKKLGGLDAYLVGDRMFACLAPDGVGLRVPSAMATELQFSREHVSSFQPAGLPANREWIQLRRADPADFAQDAEIFKAAHAYVKSQAR